MRPGRQPKLTAEQLDAARKMRAAGESIHAIMAVFPQLSRSSVYRLKLARCTDHGRW